MVTLVADLIGNNSAMGVNVMIIVTLRTTFVIHLGVHLKLWIGSNSEPKPGVDSELERVEPLKDVTIFLFTTITETIFVKITTFDGEVERIRFEQPVWIRL